MSRRSPWGPPWWIYGVAFSAANLVRQGVIIVTAAEIPQALRVASWVATALIAVVVVNTVAVALRRRGDTTHADNPIQPAAHPVPALPRAETAPLSPPCSSSSLSSTAPTPDDGPHR